MGHQVKLEELNEPSMATIAASHGEGESKKIDIVTVSMPKKIFYRVTNNIKNEVLTVQTLREAVDSYNAI